MQKFNLADGLKIDAIAGLLKGDMTGADIYSICSNSWLTAVRRYIEQYSNSGVNKELTAADIRVNINDFRKAVNNFVPSINPKDMEYFNKLRTK